MADQQGFAKIKREFIVENRDGNCDTNDHQEKTQKKRVRGIDRQREKKMSKAKIEMRNNTPYLCPSVLFPEKGGKCKYGIERCKAVHDQEKYWMQKPDDLGDNCVIFDQTGSCPYSIACYFARAHTNLDLTQIQKESNPGWQPTKNSQTMLLQQKLRKRIYEFKRADISLASLDADSIGCMEREPPKLNMWSLSGKKYLAPLTTVGNLPFRRLCVELGADITCSEMAIATNILQGNPSELSLVKRHPSEKIFGVQLAGGYSDSLSKAVELIRDNFEVDFIDLNLGCPLDCVNEKGGGCALANKPNKLVNVLQCMQMTAGAIPITVKMRYGVKEGQRTAHSTIEMFANKSPPQLLALHPRSKEQRYTKAAEWDYVDECSQVIGGKFPFFACGDVLSYQDYYRHLSSRPIDGIMIGRGALIKPWIFTEINESRTWDISASERLELIKKFVHYGLEHWGSDARGVETTRRFLLEWLSFQHRYIPVSILEEPPQRINQRPPQFRGRDDMETLLASPASSDWIKISQMFLGTPPEGFIFVPKHKANAF